VVQARFNVSVVARETDTVLSNAAVARRTPASVPGKVLHTFQMTPPMSTYLLAIVVGPLVSVGTSYVSQWGHAVEVKVWSREGQHGSLQFALEVAASALKGGCSKMP
jgi:aminopeptidase N